jgi:hypothetical protein
LDNSVVYFKYSPCSSHEASVPNKIWIPGVDEYSAYDGWSNNFTNNSTHKGGKIRED